MTHEYLRADAWRHKRDDEILQALHEIDAYTAEAQGLIHYEVKRRELDRVPSGGFAAREEPVEAPRVLRKRDRFMRWLAYATATLALAVVGSMMNNEALIPWGFGAIVLFLVIVFGWLIWTGKKKEES